jgi:hypothetical protein
MDQTGQRPFSSALDWSPTRLDELEAPGQSTPGPHWAPRFGCRMARGGIGAGGGHWRADRAGSSSNATDSSVTSGWCSSRGSTRQPRRWPRPPRLRRGGIRRTLQAGGRGHW